ncbi:hypothetical protein [Candidatus Cyanaurora vandensis]|uniref:DUF7674 family protein n=1 Tax=Candidatus Cyanaurora vandensis TaxID=2714958 RepID=UPI002579A486|nr:hypothetical protein [Candidatus Cyanaurora vandensis]
MKTNSSFIEKLLQRVPRLKPLYDEHIKENDDLLPNVFMGDVTRSVIKEAQGPQFDSLLRPLLDYLEEGIITGSDQIQELIIVSFVENLIGETVTLSKLRPLLPPIIRNEVERICG